MATDIDADEQGRRTTVQQPSSKPVISVGLVSTSNLNTVTEMTYQSNNTSSLYSQ